MKLKFSYPTLFEKILWLGLTAPYPTPPKRLLSRADGMEILVSPHLGVEERVRLVFTHLNSYFT